MSEPGPIALVRDGRPVPLAEIEAQIIRGALAACGDNRAAAARALGIGRSTLYRKLRAMAPATTEAAP